MASIIPYKTEGCYAVIGNTFSIKDKLKEYNCKFNGSLVDPKDPHKKMAGWIFFQKDGFFDQIKSIASGAPEKKTYAKKIEMSTTIADSDGFLPMVVVQKKNPEKKVIESFELNLEGLEDVCFEEDKEKSLDQFEMFDKLFGTKQKKSKDDEEKNKLEEIYNFYEMFVEIVKKDNKELIKIKGTYLLLFCRKYSEIFSHITPFARAYAPWGMLQTIVFAKEDYDNFVKLLLDF